MWSATIQRGTSNGGWDRGLSGAVGGGRVVQRLPGPRSAPDAALSTPLAGEGDDDVPLLAAKLAPPVLAHATVARPRLLDLLDRHVDACPLTLVSGPAGSGKTVLVDTWRRRQRGRRPIAWLSLDEFDDEPPVFWTYLVEALATAGVDLPHPPAQVAGEALPLRFVRLVAAGLAGSPQDVVLIVDNADHLTDRSIAAGLDLLVRTAGHRLRLVLCGRADPQLPLHQYRLSGTLAEIRTVQLAFTPEETADLLAAMGLPVTRAVAEALCAETGGWAVGLRLAAAPLAQGVPSDHLVMSLARDDGSVAQYLFAEVLSGQPAGIRRLLMRLSVTAELWPDLTDRLARRGDTRRVLSGLAHANAFVEQSPGAPGGFRIHPLFREMLMAQLGLIHPGELAELHRICASWYAAAGRTTEAIGHAVAAADWSSVTRLLVEDLVVARLLAHGADPALAALSSLPSDLPGPEAGILRAAAALAANRPADPADLAAAAAAVDDDPPVALSSALVLLVAGVGADDPPMLLERAARTTTLIATVPEDRRGGHRDAAAVVGHVRALASIAGGEPTARVLDVLRSSAAASATAGARRLRGRALALAALVRAVRGELRRAEQHAAEAMTLEAEALDGEDGVGSAPSPATAAAIGWVQLQRYAVTDARDSVARARARAQAGPSPIEAAVTEGALAVISSRLLRLRHEFDAALTAVQTQVDRPGLPAWLRVHLIGEVIHLAAAGRATITDDDLADDPTLDAMRRSRLVATAALVQGRRPPVDGLPPEDERDLAAAVESRVIRASTALADGSVPAAVVELEHGLGRARPEALRWPFFDAPTPVRHLLRTHPRLHVAAGWLNPAAPGRPVTSRAEAPVAAAAVVTQRLSEREQEVLEHLAQLLSTAEIAAVMFISLNTVRTHIRSILRKLGVTRRNQAVRRARELGILDRHS
jgi:LuxR family transcriptional regulator, maltose regulon positive regulatory protein